MKIFLSLILVLATSTAYAQNNYLKIEPLNIAMEKRGDWSNDATEVLYVGTRCASLYSIVGSYFKTNSSATEDLILGEDFTSRALVIRQGLGVLGILAKIDAQLTKARSIELFKVYAQTMENNKKLLNNAFSYPIEDDLAFCSLHEHNYVRLSQMLNDEAQKKRSIR